MQTWFPCGFTHKLRDQRKIIHQTHSVICLHCLNVLTSFTLTGIRSETYFTLPLLK